ncbi:unnamed protein product [Ambrosiozyma monospora]|uniref:Unnamed protein product n=1 Tax=Ambrosiozyma monospora TaxID=43982 RepID=A0ACB5SWZ0_AMBMO|nr:unnamed protein product [Ambrosiozyma monospora]
MLLFSLRLVNGPTLPATPAPLAAFLLGFLGELGFDAEPQPLPLPLLPVSLDCVTPVVLEAALAVALIVVLAVVVVFLLFFLPSTNADSG